MNDQLVLDKLTPSDLQLSEEMSKYTVPTNVSRDVELSKVAKKSLNQVNNLMCHDAKMSPQDEIKLPNNNPKK